MPANRSAEIKEMKTHLESIRNALHRIHTDHVLIEDTNTLQKLASVVQDLEIESQINVKDKKYKESCEIIHHLLFTPWGAPFVMDASLLEAAQIYKFQEHQASDLYKIVKNFVEHSEMSESQIFKALDDAIQSLSDYK
ncbi:MAG: hypothetical protein K9M13_02450 [Simkaniaceae bacterium]|nr:hypothetical protein [Simkaniaceae bacterium]